MSKDTTIIVPPDEMVIVLVGHLDTGLSAYGPFDDVELAEDFMERVVDKRLPSQWMYLGDPAPLDSEPAAICMSCGEGPCVCNIHDHLPRFKVLKKPVRKELPPASEIVTNADGKVIGEQLVIA